MKWLRSGKIIDMHHVQGRNQGRKSQSEPFPRVDMAQNVLLNMRQTVQTL